MTFALHVEPTAESEIRKLSCHFFIASVFCLQSLSQPIVLPVGKPVEKTNEFCPAGKGQDTIKSLKASLVIALRPCDAELLPVHEIELP